MVYWSVTHVNRCLNRVFNYYLKNPLQSAVGQRHKILFLWCEAGTEEKDWLLSFISNVSSIYWCFIWLKSKSCLIDKDNNTQTSYKIGNKCQNAFTFFFYFYYINFFYFFYSLVIKWLIIKDTMKTTFEQKNLICQKTISVCLKRKKKCWNR